MPPPPLPPPPSTSVCPDPAHHRPLAPRSALGCASLCPCPGRLRGYGPPPARAQKRGAPMRGYYAHVRRTAVGGPPGVAALCVTSAHSSRSKIGARGLTRRVTRGCDGRRWAPRRDGLCAAPGAGLAHRAPPCKRRWIHAAWLLVGNRCKHAPGPDSGLVPWEMAAADWLEITAKVEITAKHAGNQ